MIHTILRQTSANMLSRKQPGYQRFLHRHIDFNHIPVAVKAEIGDVVLPEFIQVTAISEFGQHYVSGAIGTKRSTVMTTFLSVSNFTTNIIN